MMETLHVNSPSLHAASAHEFSTAGLDELQDDEGLELDLDLDTSFTAAHDAMGLNDVQADPDSELEAIRKSVRRLREQRHAVLRLKAFASKSNARAANLKLELASVRQQLHKLQRDSARQTSLQRAVAELRESLKQQQQATSEKVSKDPRTYSSSNNVQAQQQLTLVALLDCQIRSKHCAELRLTSEH
jgi:predicted RNase H-like nuclease (RuvC/YqgF family)